MDGSWHFFSIASLLFSGPTFLSYAFKRWIKVLGHPIMALILLTEPDPDEALVRLMKRSAYVLMTFSILAIKYYPDIGRRYDDWSGLAVNVGISQSKNTLGCGCLVLGFFFIWHFLRTWRTEQEQSPAKRASLDRRFAGYDCVSPPKIARCNCHVMPANRHTH